MWIPGLRAAWFAALLLGPALSAQAQQIEPLAPSGRPAKDFPSPDRPVAEIISPIWATEKERDATNEAGQVTGFLGIAPGMTVGDIGAGSGYYTVRLAHLVGPSGRVFAEDVTRSYLADLGKRVAKEKLANVTLALGEPHDPRLPAGSLDAALLVHMYHEIAQPYAFLANLAPALKPGAKVGIVDLPRVTWEHGTPPDLLRCELEAAGYRQLAFHELRGGSGYLAIFTRAADTGGAASTTLTPCRLQRS